MKLALGTVQFGLKYGLTQNNEKVSFHETQSILKKFLSKGGCYIDTASAYGDAESTIGLFKKRENFSIITKIESFSKKNIVFDDKEKILNCFNNSLDKLNIKSCEALLVHNCNDLFKPNGDFIYEVLQEIKQSGKVKKIGVSVYETEEINKIITSFDFDIIQLPFNLYDQRLLNNGTLDKLKSLGVEIHARSIFLQGLLLMCSNQWPSYFNNLKKHHKKTMQLLSLDNFTILDACIAFVNNISQIDKIIVGVNTTDQLNQIFKSLEKKAVILDYFKYAFEDLKILNPKLWTLK